jgi:hypothetical protein
MTESTKLKNHFNRTALKQWWIERRYSTSTIIANNRSETSSSYELCIPFYSCSTDVNRIVLIILVSGFILICCFHYQCYEYCMVKHKLEAQTLPSSQKYRYIVVSKYNDVLNLK